MYSYTATGLPRCLEVHASLPSLLASLANFAAAGGGVIDAAELRASLVTLGHQEPSGAEVALMIAALDADRSGGIEWDEFLKVGAGNEFPGVGAGSTRRGVAGGTQVFGLAASTVHAASMP